MRRGDGEAMRATAWFLALAVLGSSEVARARAVRTHPPPQPPDTVDAEVRVAPSPPPLPPRWVTLAELRAALVNARPDMEACLSPGSRTRGTVRARLSDRLGLTLSVTLAPTDDRARACVDTAARRWLVPLEGRGPPRPVSASIRFGASGSAIPPSPPRPLNPPSPPSNHYDEAHVHARLDAARGEFMRCLPVASTSAPGEVVLRFTVRPDGSLTLEGASLPAGVRAGAALDCLAAGVARVRVPGPSAPRALTHVFALGR